MRLGLGAFPFPENHPSREMLPAMRQHGVFSAHVENLAAGFPIQFSQLGVANPEGRALRHPCDSGLSLVSIAFRSVVARGLGVRYSANLNSRQVSLGREGEVELM